QLLEAQHVRVLALEELAHLPGAGADAARSRSIWAGRGANARSRTRRTTSSSRSRRLGSSALQLAHEVTTGGLDEVEHVLETFRPAVVRVGYVLPGDEQPHLVPVLARRHALERVQVPPVHRQDEIEAREVLLRHLARAQLAQVVAAVLGMVLCPL